MTRYRRPAALVTALFALACAAACTSAPADEPAASTPAAPTTTAAPATAEPVVPDVVAMPAGQASAELAAIDVVVQVKSTTDGTDVPAAEAAALPVVYAYPEPGQPIGAGRLVVLYVTPAETAPAADLTTDEGLCAADAAMTNLELNDALAPVLGFPADRDSRTVEQDDAIRAYKNDAFARACPERAS